MPSIACFALAALLPAAAVAISSYTPQSAAVTGTTTSIAPLGFLKQPVYASVINEEPGTTLYALQCGCSDPKTASTPCPCGVLQDTAMTLTAGPTSWAYTYTNAKEQVSSAYNCSVVPEAKTGACFEYVSQGGFVSNDVKSIFGKGYTSMFTPMIITAGPTGGAPEATKGGAAATKSGSSQASPTSSSLATRNMGESFALAGAVALGAAALAL